MTFFTSSLLSRIGRSQKSKLNVNVEKGAIRDVWQVLANGSAAAAMVLLFHLVVHRWGFDASRSVLMLYLSALAAVNSDTWATEIGRMSRQTPRSLATWKPVESGTSGAITLWGTVAAVLGSIVIPLSLLSFWGLTPPEFICVTWAGFLGSFLDSILGASLQAHYRDPQTGSLTEMREIDGRRTKLVRGLAWMNNDTVNLMAGVGGILCAWVLLKYCVTPFQ